MISKKQAEKICRKLGFSFQNVKFLARGNHNETYLLDTKEKKLVIRIQNSSQSGNLSQEYSILKKVNGKGAPKAYLIDKSRKILKNSFVVEDFVTGKHPERKVPDSFVVKMAGWYKQLHKNKKKITPKTKKECDLLNRFLGYQKSIVQNKAYVPTTIYTELEQFFPKIKSLLEKYASIFNRRSYFSLVHGDPTRTNVFLKGNDITIIDWEFTRYDYPETDLVFFDYSYDLTKKQKDLFFKEYDYKKTTIGKNILRLFYIDHYLGVLNWRVGRFVEIAKGKADKRQSASNKKQMIIDAKDDIKNLHEYF